MAIQVLLDDHTGNIRHTVKMADNAQVQRLIPALLSSLHLPATDPSGRPINYFLSHNGRALQADETLMGAGVLTGDVLTIVPEMTAGASCEPVHRDDSPALIEGMELMWEYSPVSGVPHRLTPLLRSGGVAMNLPAAVLSGAWEHALLTSDIEVGGLLVGQVFEAEGGYVVDVQDSIKAQETVTGPAMLTFTSASWMGMDRQRRLAPHLAVVGWYHTHPGHGIYLSGADIFLHRSFFGRRPWYVALVIDPQKRKWGTFRCDEDRVLSVQTGLIPLEAVH